MLSLLKSFDANLVVKRLVIEHCVKMIYFLKGFASFTLINGMLHSASFFFSPLKMLQWAFKQKKHIQYSTFPLPFLGLFLFDHETLIRVIQSAANLLNVTKMFIQRFSYRSLFFSSLSRIYFFLGLKKKLKRRKEINSHIFSVHIC